jgi:DnaJ-class molecular chaperone
MTFLRIYCPSMAKIDHASQPELPIAQQITCRRCNGVGTVYYARMRAEIIGGKRVTCPECNGTGGLDLAEQLFRYVTVSHDKKRPRKRRRQLNHSVELLL